MLSSIWLNPVGGKARTKSKIGEKPLCAVLFYFLIKTMGLTPQWVVIQEAVSCTHRHRHRHRQTDTHTHLAIAPLPKDGEKLKALRPDSLAVSVDGGTGQLHLFRLDTNMRRQDESRVNGTLLSPAQIFRIVTW